MQIVGKQGSRLTGRQFAKMMDVLAETTINMEKGFLMTTLFRIPILLWVDDVVSFAEGKLDQIEMLNIVDDFAVRHKLEWSTAKCKVMCVGTHKNETNEWNLGTKQIEETKQYRYLGDEVTNNGKNTENIKMRRQKIQATTATINNIASNEILNRVESLVLLELHERITIPSLLNNAESWTLNRSEMEDLERIEIQPLKNLFRLPLQTPNAAIIFAFGTLYTKQRVDKIQLKYLHKILNRQQEHWTLKSLKTLEQLNIGWAKAIKNTLEEYNLPTDFEQIRIIPRPEWERGLTSSIESKNLERLIESCHKKEGENRKLKTKTASIVPIITASNYKRKPQNNILRTNKQETRTIVMARYGVLECGKNYKGTMRETCDVCICIDDENHRINSCTKWKHNNLYESAEKVDFNEVYSDELVNIRHVTDKIEKVWNTRTAYGSMHT